MRARKPAAWNRPGARERTFRQRDRWRGSVSYCRRCRQFACREHLSRAKESPQAELVSPGRIRLGKNVSPSLHSPPPHTDFFLYRLRSAAGPGSAAREACQDSSDLPDDIPPECNLAVIAEGVPEY